MGRGGKKGRPRIRVQSNLVSASEVKTDGVSTGTEQGSSQSNQIIVKMNEIVIEWVVEQPDQAKPKGSSASVVHPDNGIELKFIPTEVINRTNVAKIDPQDVKKGIDATY